MKQVVLLLAGLSTSAVTFAAPVTVAQIDAARADGTLQQAWMTGASAPTLTLYAGWVRGCDLDTNTVFGGSSSSDRPGNTGNYAAYACTRSGRVSVLYHTLDGGSLNAYTPHTVGSVLGRLKFIGTGNGCKDSVNYVDSLNPNNNALVYRGCTVLGVGLATAGATPEQNQTNSAALLTDPNGPQWPTGGLSDVEAALFPNSIGGGLQVSKFGTESDVGVGQVFTVVASIPLYRAMQTAQGISIADDPNFAPENAPNITSAQYAGIASTGGERNWSSILPGNTNEVILARRFDTSGSQASSDAFFLRSPCNSGVNQQLAKRTKADSVPGEIEVFEASGSGDVTGKVSSASTATDPKKSFAIGVLSAETNWRTQSSGRNGFRVLKLDGVHPELNDTNNARLTATNGHYKFHMELKSYVRSDYAGKPAKTPFEARIIGEVSEALKNPVAATCSKLSRGLTLNPINGSDCTIGVEVARMTNQGQNCAVPIQFF